MESNNSEILNTDDLSKSFSISETSNPTPLLNLPTIRVVIPFSQFLLYSPKSILSCLGKNCEVALCDKTSRKGYFYSIDPETNHVLLLEKNEVHNFEPILIFSHAIHSIEFFHSDKLQILVDGSDNIKDLIKESEQKKLTLTQEQINQRMQEVKLLLEKNQIPFVHESESQSFFVLSCLRITSPYLVSSCYSSNPIVLSKIQALIETIPLPKLSN